MGLLADTAAAIARGDRTAEAAVGEALERAEATEPALNAFTMLFAEEARALAKDPPPGLLSGVPVAVKDLFDMAGVVTSGASRVYEDNVASTDSPAVASLREAGAIIIGKTNMHELAFGATSSVSCFGRVNNPWDVERMPGGSSGGSGAAVAAGITGLALGSDTGGSVRIPASFCGVSALKTTYGLISLEGVLPLAVSLDTVGPIASDVDDLALAMRVLAGVEAERRDDLAGLSIGVPLDYYFDATDPEVSSAVHTAARDLESAGARLVDASFAALEETEEAWPAIACPEFARAHPILFERPGVAHRDMQALAEAGRAMTAERQAIGRALATRVADVFASAFRHVDAIIAPATPMTAPRHDDAVLVLGGREVSVHTGGPSQRTRLVNVAGLPALAMPCGPSSRGLPIGLQLIGPRGADARLLGIGAVYQRTTEHHRARPSHS